MAWSVVGMELVLAYQFSYDDACGRRAGESAARGFFQVGGHGIPDGTDGVDDFVGGNLVLDARQCHIGARQGIDGADDVALDTGDFHQSGDGVANQSHQVGQCHGAGV